MIRCVIIDDESKAIQNLQWELDNHCKMVEVVRSFTEAQEAISFLNQTEEPIDVVFLDIQMPRMTGLQWLDHIGQRELEVIVISAHDRYVFKSLKYDVFDYLMKPIDSEALKDSVRRLSHKLSRSSLVHRLEDRLQGLIQDQTGRKKVHFSLGSQELFVYMDDLIFFKADGNYCELKHAKGETFFLSHKLGSVMKVLDSRFFRVHNSYVVNLDRVLIYDKKAAQLLLDDGTKVPVSRRRKVDFLNQF